MIIWIPSYPKSGNTWEKLLNHKIEKIVREIFFKEMNELEYI